MISYQNKMMISALSSMVENPRRLTSNCNSGTNNQLELLEKMNLKVAEEYKGFGDVASGLRVFVEQLKSKSGNFYEYVQQIDAIEQQVTEFEAVISLLDKYVSLLVKSSICLPSSTSINIFSCR
ncbi:Biogenesis of lysosome-related organelles complex 1 subunit 2 [Camellia lanceoleosa]|uniref:Biogenesis of lysosome-related organelles complex 1 subunit 2 n=1 Tax=Camellia lanceoleosa TaxID=1840588 RepID=A0ACC0I1Q8_9ERIC|nr:Biogenesis of lysosome-related organelles complex 1 subunit 2 [Camellia lanceoleosa]